MSIWLAAIGALIRQIRDMKYGLVEALQCWSCKFQVRQRLVSQHQEESGLYFNRAVTLAKTTLSWSRPVPSTFISIQPITNTAPGSPELQEYISVHSFTSANAQ